MTEFANPEAYEPDNYGEVSHEQMVMKQVETCRKALNKPAVRGYMGSAQLDNANHPQIRTSVMAKKWVHGTNHKACSCVESLHDLTRPVHDETYEEADEELREVAVKQLKDLFEHNQEYMAEEDFTTKKVFRETWPVVVRPLIRERFNNLLELCARQNIIGGIQGVEDEG